jgi:hypothetical protein
MFVLETSATVIECLPYNLSTELIKSLLLPTPLPEEVMAIFI